MGSKTQTVQEKADPWGPAQPYLRRALKQGQSLFDRGGFAPQRSFGGTTRQAQNMVLSRARRGAPTIEAAQGTLAGMMDPNYQSDRLDAVKQEALADAIPAAAGMFSGSGLANSSMAMDTVGRAATQAVAPIEYGAFENAQDRALRATAMAPTIEQAGYLPAQMIGQVGAQQDQLQFERANRDLQNYQGYLSAMMGLGGMGGSGISTGPGASGAQRLIGGGLAGLGTAASLGQMGLGVGSTGLTAALGGPVGIAAGLGAGLLGLL